MIEDVETIVEPKADVERKDTRRTDVIDDAADPDEGSEEEAK